MASLTVKPTRIFYLIAITGQFGSQFVHESLQESMLPSSIAVKPVTTSAPASTGPTKRSLKIEEWKRRKGII